MHVKEDIGRKQNTNANMEIMFGKIQLLESAIWDSFISFIK